MEEDAFAFQCCGTALSCFYFVLGSVTVKLCSSEGNFVSSLIKDFLWSSLSSFGFPLQR